MFIKLQGISNITVFLILAIASLLYINTFSNSQNLIELALLHSQDPSFLPYDLVINSYADNPLNSFALLLLELYQSLFLFDKDFFFLNFAVKTFTIFGIYKIYQYFILHRFICLIGALIHLSPSIKILPYFGDWFIISPALHTNSIFFLCFVYFLWSLLNHKYLLASSLQIFGMLAHPPLGLFLALPIQLLFYFCHALKGKKIFFNNIKGTHHYLMIMIFFILNLIYLIKLNALNTVKLNAEEFINIYFLHAPHHYEVSSFSLFEILWPYCFAICGYLSLIRHEKNPPLRLFFLILSPLILLSVPLHYLFTEVYPSVYIISLHLLRSASVLSLAWLAPYAIMLFLPKAYIRVSSNDA
jgi:hypothetical protein